MKGKILRILIAIVLFGIIVDAYQAKNIKRAFARTFKTVLHLKTGVEIDPMNMDMQKLKDALVEKIEKESGQKIEDTSVIMGDEFQKLYNFLRITEVIVTVMILLFLLFDFFAYFKLFRLRPWARKYFIVFYFLCLLLSVADILVVLQKGMMFSTISSNPLIWGLITVFYVSALVFLLHPAVKSKFVK